MKPAMNVSPTIVLDAMGGDAGVMKRFPAANLHFKHPFPIKLVGIPGEIQSVLNRHKHATEWIEIVPSAGAIPMEAKPEALAQRSDSSIQVAADWVAETPDAALVSAGHTGATILAASRRFTCLPGISEPHWLRFIQQNFPMVLEKIPSPFCWTSAPPWKPRRRTWSDSRNEPLTPAL